MDAPDRTLESSIAARCEAFVRSIDRRLVAVSGMQPPVCGLARQLADARLLGLTIAETKGGKGEGVLAAVSALEEVGRRCPVAVDPLYFGNFSVARVIGEAADDALRTRVLDGILAGRAILPMAITEPEAGSAAGDLAARAEPDDDGYRVSGIKRFTAYVDDAAWIAVGVRFGEGVETIGAVVLPKDAPGLSLGPRQHFMSGETWREIRLDAVAVPRGDVILSGGLFTQWGRLFDCDKLGTAARALGLALHAFDAARAYATERRQFGRALCEFQSMQVKFGSMDAQLTAARLVLHAAAQGADRGEAVSRQAAMAKLLCSEAALSVCGEAVQIMGATGYSDLSEVGFCQRKAQGLALTSGTTELLKIKLAESVFGRAFPQATPKP